MPGPHDIGIDVVSNGTKQELCYNNSDTGTNGKSPNSIRRATRVALGKIQSPTSRLQTSLPFLG